MKIRESGMPEREMWENFFDPVKTLATLGISSQTGDVAEFGCGYGTFTIAAARIARQRGDAVHRQFAVRAGAGVDRPLLRLAVHHRQPLFRAHPDLGRRHRHRGHPVVGQAVGPGEGGAEGRNWLYQRKLGLSWLCRTQSGNYE